MLAPADLHAATINNLYLVLVWLVYVYRIWLLLLSPPEPSSKLPRVLQGKEVDQGTLDAKWWDMQQGPMRHEPSAPSLTNAFRPIEPVPHPANLADMLISKLKVGYSDVPAYRNPNSAISTGYDDVAPSYTPSQALRSVTQTRLNSTFIPIDVPGEPRAKSPASKPGVVLFDA